MSICKWCGKEFTKEHNRQEYCSETCKENGYKEKHRICQDNYRKRWKNVMTEKQKYGLGSYGSRLGPHANNDVSIELNLIQTEMRILKLR